MDQLEFYVTLKLADDPTLDGNLLIEEFFQRYYGAAASPMRQLYSTIEETFTNPRNYPDNVRQALGHHHQNAMLAWEFLGTDSRMQALGKIMAQAQALARPGIEAERVAVFERGQWQYLLEGRKEYSAKAERRDRSLPKVTVPRVAAARGEADRVPWAKAALLDGWSSLAGEPTKRRVEGRIAHDGAFLYLQLTEWLDPASLKPGGEVWEGDDFEVFVAARRGAGSRQFAVAPDGRHLAKAYGEVAQDWDSGAKVSSDSSGHERWTVRIALPLDKLLAGGVEPGGTFYANLYRASPGAPGLLAWTPTFTPGFHDTNRLGEFVLDRKPAP